MATAQEEALKRIKRETQNATQRIQGKVTPQVRGNVVNVERPQPAQPQPKPQPNPQAQTPAGGMSQPFQFKAPEKFSYNPQTDPAYQAALREARRNLATSQANTNARLRAQGQGNSSYSETLQNQLANQAMSRVADTTLPQMMSQAYQRYADRANRDLQVQQANYGVQQDNRQLALQEGQLTGNYQSPQARGLIDQLFGLKQQAEAPGISMQQLRDYSSQADDIRNRLSGLGIDTSGIGADDNLSAARQNAAGLGAPTMAAQQFQRGIQESDRAFGFQQQQAEQAQQNLEEEKAYRAQQDTEENRRWWAQYERDGQQFAQQMGYNWANLNQRDKEFLADQAYRQQQFSADQSYRQQQLSLQQQQQDLSRDRFNLEQQLSQTPEPAPQMTFDEGFDIVQNMPGVYQNGFFIAPRSEQEKEAIFARMREAGIPSEVAYKIGATLNILPEGVE